MQPDPAAIPKLTFPKPNGSFSFDLGGLLRGGEVHNQEFFAEVKNYKDASDQPAHYRDFLAKCFRAYSMRPERCDHFMWITWSPFNATEWSKLDSADKVKLCVRERWQFNFASEQEAAGSTLDSRMIKEVAERIWVLVLSDKQINHLSMSDENLAVIAMHEVLEGARK
ncbi:hypothetical protein FOH10_18920 [Nocardia otitidiscaviarum]|uniref:Uncharacterized protein n=2 Tax=Nocardia otitidiscaviarum TaxID=1823 RepID=A0A516NNL8_9NOCA|nr:hypothetical protein FOH10_18920 [Nocardia otitidiscaviarum]